MLDTTQRRESGTLICTSFLFQVQCNCDTTESYQIPGLAVGGLTQHLILDSESPLEDQLRKHSSDQRGGDGSAEGRRQEDPLTRMNSRASLAPLLLTCSSAQAADSSAPALPCCRETLPRPGYVVALLNWETLSSRGRHAQPGPETGLVHAPALLVCLASP